MSQRRTFKMAEQIQEFIAWELQRVADPRFHLVTVTSVILSPDKRNAKVYWIVSGGPERREEVTEAFESAAGLFKRAIAKGLKVRFIPELKFYYDDTFDTSDEVARLLEKARGGGA